MTINVTEDLLAAGLDETLAAETAGLGEIERTIELHEHGVLLYARRRADARKAGKADLARLDAERRRLKLLFEADMRRLDEESAAARTLMADRIATAERLKAVSTAALELLS